MPATPVSLTQSLNASDMCEYCGNSAIDLWKAISCEHSICKNCLLKDVQPSGAFHCTNCNETCPLVCPGSKFGCKYKTSVARNCVEHLRTCPLRPTPCPNECSFVVANTDLAKHLVEECANRVKECRFCRDNHFVSELTNHYKKCIEFPVTCQHCNQENIRRGSLEEHGSDCRKTPKLCRMAALGCTFKAGDDEMERHMTLERHAVGIHDLKIQVNSLEAEVRQLREERIHEREERVKASEQLKKELQRRDEELKQLRDTVKVLQANLGLQGHDGHTESS